MDKTKPRQIIKNALIAIGALAAFYLFIGVQFKDWTMYQYVGAGMVAVIVMIVIIRVVLVLKKRSNGGEEQMPKKQKKGAKEFVSTTTQPISADFGFPMGGEPKAHPKAGTDFVASIKERIDGLAGILKLGTDELTKQYEEINRMEGEINKKAKELHEQWMKLKEIKQMIEDILRIQQMKRQQQEQGWHAE